MTDRRHTLWPVMFGIFSLAAVAAEPDAECRAHLDATFPHWKIAVPPRLAARYATEANRAPNRIEGNFDGVQPSDVVLLINADGVDREIAAWEDRQLAFCLRAGTGVTLKIRDRLYCSDKIVRVPAGSEIQNVDTDVITKPAHDGVAAICIGAASAVYFFEGDEVSEIVNGD